MHRDALAGCTILVAEDEYMIAMDLKRELSRAGASVLGPAASIEKVMQLIRSADRIDGAILDVNLQGELVFAAADLLRERSVPFLFTTGYDQSVIEPRFEGVLRCEKPIGPEKLSRALATAMSNS